jgi:hypothetical protein
MADYKRCQYVSPEGIECEVWFPLADGEIYCEKYHRGIPSVSDEANGEQKQLYIDLCNAERNLCATMTLDQLDAHIATIEAAIEAFMAKEKPKRNTARAVRAEKLEALTEDQRRERRKIKLAKEVKEGRKVLSKPSKPRIKRETIFDKMSIADKQAAVTGDIEEMIRKFQEAQSKKVG